jgi:chaperonin GroES
MTTMRIVVVAFITLLASFGLVRSFLAPTKTTRRTRSTIQSTIVTTTSTKRRTFSTLSTPTIDFRSSSVLQSSASSSYTLDGKEIRRAITPLGNFIVVRLKDTLQATSGGILLPDQSKERPTEGVVIESGPGKLHPFTGTRITNPIQKGINVLFGKYDGTPINYNGEECQMIRDDNVLLTYTGVTMRLDDVMPVRDYVLIELNDGSSSSESESESNTGGVAVPGYATRSGIVIASAVMKDLQPCEGIVVKVGEGRMASNGQLTTSPVSVGDAVKFKDYAGNEIQIEGKDYSVVKMVDILCTRRPE